MSNFSKEHIDFIKKTKNRSRKIKLTSFFILVAFIIIWEILGQLNIIDPFITSMPSRIIKSFIKFYKDGTLFTHIAVTTGETIVGFLVSTVLGTIIAVLLWWSDFAYKVLEPFIVVLNALPKVALAPIIIFWVGNGISAIIIIALLISIVVTIITVLAGFQEVDTEKIKLLKTFGSSKFQILTNLIIPASIPTIISALKINVGLSWVGVIMGEYLVARAGLGFLIVFGGQISQLDMVMMSIIILATIAYLMFKLVSYLEEKIRY